MCRVLGITCFWVKQKYVPFFILHTGSISGNIYQPMPNAWESGKVIPAKPLKLDFHPKWKLGSWLSCTLDPWHRKLSGPWTRGQGSPSSLEVISHVTTVMLHWSNCCISLGLFPHLSSGTIQELFWGYDKVMHLFAWSIQYPALFVSWSDPPKGSVGSPKETLLSWLHPRSLSPATALISKIWFQGFPPLRMI